MPKQLALRNRSWRPQQLFGDQARRRRNVRRVTAVMGGLLLVGAFLWMVSRPMAHVNTRIVFLTVEANRNLGDYGPPFAQQTLAGLEHLAPALVRESKRPGRPRQLPTIVNDQSLLDISSALNESALPSDALILVVSAPGLVIGGEPYLLGSEFDPAQPRRGAIAVGELLENLKARIARTKLVVLDTGYHAFDPRAGLFVNDFVHRLQSVIERAGDEKLWVLAPNASHEHPRLSPAMRRTVFSFFVTEGLRGAADANFDQQITIPELHHFVTANVGEWTRQATNGRETQTPQLFHASAGPPTDDNALNLLSVSMIAPELRMVDTAKAVADADAYRQSLPPVRLNENADLPTAPFLPMPNGSDDLQHRWQDWERFIAALNKAPDPPSGSGKPADSPADTPDNADSANSAEPTEDASVDEGETVEPVVEQRTIDLYRERSVVVHELLALRQAIRSDSNHFRRILKRAPHLWREFELRLHIAWRGLEQQPISASDTRYEELRRLLPTIRALSNRSTSLPDSRRGLPKRFASAWNGESLPQPSANLAGALIDDPSPELKKFATDFDDAIRNDTISSEELLKLAPPKATGLEEVRLLRELSERDHAAGQHLRWALLAVRLANQLATRSHAHTPWVLADMERGDMFRNDGLRDLRDRRNAEDQHASSEATDKLLAACEAYLEAAAKLQAIYAAQDVHDRTLYEMPELLQWSALSLDAAPTQSISGGRLEALLTHVRRIAQLLDAADPSTVAELKLECGLAIEQYQRVHSGLTIEAVEVLANTRLPADRLGVDALLQTRLPNATLASKLLDNQLLLDLELTEQFKAPLFVKNAVPMSDAATQRRWETYRDLARATIEFSEFVANKPVNSFLPFDEAVESRENQEQRWRTSSELESAISNSLGELPLLIDESVANTAVDAIEPLRIAHRAMLSMDGRDVDQLTSQRANRPLLALERHQFLLGRARAARLAQAFEDEPARSQLAMQADRLSLEAAKTIGADEAEPDNRPLVSIQCAARKSPDGYQLLTIQLRNHGSQGVFLWVTADTNDPSVEVAREAAGVYAICGDRLSGRQLTVASAPTLQLAAGQSRELVLPLKLEADAAGAVSANVRVVASRQAKFASEAAAATLLGHHVVPLKIENTYLASRVWIGAPQDPQFTLDISGPDNCVAPRDHGFRLFVFPNRDTKFKLSMTSLSGGKQQALVKLLRTSVDPVSLPGGAIPRPQAENLLRQIGASTELVAPIPVEFNEANETAPLPFPQPADEAAPEAPSDASPTTPSAPNVGLSSSFVAVVESNDRIVLRQFFVEVQHPRRYTLPTVRYSLQRQRIEIEVAALSGATLPDGPIPVSVYLDAPLEAGASSRLEATVESDQNALLHIDLPPSAGTMATVRLDVDGYPRAFSFQVRCDANEDAKPLEQFDVRIQSPGKFQTFRAPTPTIPAKLQVDAPPGALSDPNHYVEVGVDQDMDRDFRGDRTIRLSGARSLAAAVSGTSPEGELTIRATAKDFEVQVPASGLRNVQVSLLAQIRVNSIVAQDSVEEIWLDGLPPRIIVQGIDPGRIVEAGTAVTLQVDSVDDQLGFVKKVEAAFDALGTGAFDPDAPPVEATREQGTRWTVTMPTDALPLGRHTLLIRATDHVGNPGVYQTVRLEIVAPTPEGDKNKGRIIGLVRYRDAPTEGATITIDGDAGAPLDIAEVTSNDQGAFVINDLPIGKYIVTVRLLRRNARLKLEQEVDVVAPPARPDLMKFDFK